jgi:hypothetical protein
MTHVPKQEAQQHPPRRTCIFRETNVQLSV